MPGRQAALATFPRAKNVSLRFRLNSVINGIVQHLSTSLFLRWVRALALLVLIALLSHGTAVAGGSSCDDAPPGPAGQVYATDGTNDAHPGDVAHPENCCAISICGLAIVGTAQAHYQASAPLLPQVASQGLIGQPIRRVERPPIAG